MKHNELQQTLPAADAFVAPTTEPSSTQCNEEQGSGSTPTAVPTTAVRHDDLHCTPLYKSTGFESEVTDGKRMRMTSRGGGGGGSKQHKKMYCLK
jgi:hypothetical protein